MRILSRGRLYNFMNIITIGFSHTIILILTLDHAAVMQLRTVLIPPNAMDINWDYLRPKFASGIAERLPFICPIALLVVSIYSS